MSTTHDLLAANIQKLRTALSGISYGLNRTALVTPQELNDLRQQAGHALTLTNTVEVLYLQTTQEQDAVRGELENIGNQIQLLTYQLNPDMIKTTSIMKEGTTDNFDADQPHPYTGR